MRFLFTSLLLMSISLNAAMAYETKAKQAIIVDDTTQTILLSKEANTRMYPSSMSKLMTLYILFDKLKSGAVTLDTTFPVSEKAWKKGGSKMFVKVNTEVRVEDLIRGIIVQSGNDACIVVAEALGGSEEAFAQMMNEKAKALGMEGSHFMNATGWPDEQHYMNAADLALLSHRLVHDFPDYYPYFAESEFTYSGIKQPNRNRLIGKGIGVDGLKTGHTEAAGYGITVSAQQSEAEQQRRVHVVVNGLESDAERISEARRLVEYGFREFAVSTLKQPAQPVAMLPVWMGDEESVTLSLKEPLEMAVPRDHSKMRFVMKAMAPVKAPVEADQVLAVLEIYNDQQLMKAVPLVAKDAVAEAGLVRTFIQKLSVMLEG